MADAQDATDKKLDCPICLEIFQSPKVLPCFHTFCEKCICKHVRGLREEGIQSDTITCPVCRNPCPAPTTDQTPDDWAFKLPKNSILVSILESAKSKNDDAVYCQPCLTEGKQLHSVAYCVTCTEYLCHVCYKCHKKFRATKDHKITEQCMPETHILEIAQDMYMCSVHKEKHAYYCSDHKDFCCSKCAIRHHRKCENLSSIEDLTKDLKDRQDSVLAMEDLEALNKMFHKLLENRKNHLDSIDQQKIEVQTGINQWTSSLKELVEKLEEVSLAELEQICKQETVEASDQIIECKSAIAAIEMSQRILSESENSDDKTKFITFNKVSGQLLKYLQKYDALENRSENMELEYHHNKDFEEVTQNLSSLGQVMKKVSRIPILTPESSFQETLLMLPNVQRNSGVTFNAEIPSDENSCNICSGVFLPDDRIVLCDAGNENLKLFDRYFHFVSDLTMSSKPRYICGVDKQTVAVTVGNKIYLVTVTNTLIQQKIIYVGSDCYGIISYMQNILVCVSRHNVYTYDASCRVIKKIKVNVCELGDNALCISPDGKLIHCKLDTKIVTIDTEGKKVKQNEIGESKGLSGIAVDNRGLIYCSGNKSRNVILMTPEGRQLSVLLSGADGLSSPRGICLNDRNTTIVVFEKGSSEVKVFKLS